MDWRSLPSLSALRAFAALAETGSFTRAGAALNVSHAAISQQVRALEERLGVALLPRDGRRGVLTPAGERLAAALEAGFGGIARAVDELTGADADRPLHVSTTPAFAANWLMPRLASFRHEHPEVELMLNPTHLRRRPRARRRRRRDPLRPGRLARARFRAADPHHLRPRRRPVARRHHPPHR